MSTLSSSPDRDRDGPEELPFPQPPSSSESAFGDFPPLPPPPESEWGNELPSLSDELWQHGGAHLYQPEGDRWNWPDEHSGTHVELLRLPESWLEPRPLSVGSEFLGSDPIHSFVPPPWLWPSEYVWDPRFTAFGSYELFGFAARQTRQRQDAIGHQALVELDIRLTGTERFHVQFRPLGRRNTGGSFYQFSTPQRYEDNATGIPDRFWFEGELHSILGPTRDPRGQRYVNFVVGQFPLQLHNSLMMNDDVLGTVVSKNNLQIGTLSNVNIQLLAGFDGVDTFPGIKSEAYGLHASIDDRKTFYEMTYAFVRAPLGRCTHFGGISRTQSYGPCTLAVRALFKQGDTGGTGSSQLLTLETNSAFACLHNCWGLEHGVGFCNLFWAGEGWTSMGGGNLNRLRTAFVVNPLVRLAAGPATDDVLGISVGVQLFRRHDDESLIPEVACEFPGGKAVVGLGLRYLRKTGPRTFLELLAFVNGSDDLRIDRDGAFASHSWVF